MTTMRNESNLCYRQILYSIKARTVMMVSTPAFPRNDENEGGMSSVALQRVVDTATATYNER